MAPVSAAQAATSSSTGALRGLAHPDRPRRQMIDERIRANPEAAYDYTELFRGMTP